MLSLALLPLSPRLLPPLSRTLIAPRLPSLSLFATCPSMYVVSCPLSVPPSVFCPHPAPSHLLPLVFLFHNPPPPPPQTRDSDSKLQPGPRQERTGPAPMRYAAEGARRESRSAAAEGVAQGARHAGGRALKARGSRPPAGLRVMAFAVSASRPLYPPSVGDGLPAER